MEHKANPNNSWTSSSETLAKAAFHWWGVDTVTKKGRTVLSCFGWVFFRFEEGDVPSAVAVTFLVLVWLSRFRSLRLLVVLQLLIIDDEIEVFLRFAVV